MPSTETDKCEQRPFNLSINYEEYFYTEDLENFWKFANISGLKKEEFDTIAQNNNNEVLFEYGESDENKQASLP